ncbi:MAG: YceI family protein [Balneolaceae bacterium]|nr:YceI family protein [Balneolaceae bacterium]MBO6546255.1 YceI family protein [Balneolaceae bacterium]MBO6648614.1 YceI family protein [Balneolaceae bacterium]
MKKLFTFLTMLVVSFPLSAQSFYSETGTAKFTSSVPLHNFTGTSESLVGMIKLDDMSVDFYIDLETLDTGNAKRDKDMLITLETDKHPFAEFFGEITSDFDPESSSEQPVTVKGDFTIHGGTKEVEIDGTITKTEGGLLVKADWILNLEDYDIEPPRLLIVKVDEEQAIEIEVLLKPVEEG